MELIVTATLCFDKLNNVHVLNSALMQPAQVTSIRSECNNSKQMNCWLLGIWFILGDVQKFAKRGMVLIFMSVTKGKCFPPGEGVHFTRKCND